MSVAQTYALRSTCSRKQVGAVLARDGRVLSTGYNGAPAGMPHCDHTCTCSPITEGRSGESWTDAPAYAKATGLTLAQVDKQYGLTHRDRCPAGMPCTVAVHAETNAVAYAARHGVATEGSQIYITAQPCLPCAQIIINAGITRVFYLDEYRDPSGADLLRRAGIQLTRMGMS